MSHVSGVSSRKTYEPNVFTVSSRFGTIEYCSRSEAKQELKVLLEKVPSCFEEEFLQEVCIFDHVL